MPFKPKTSKKIEVNKKHIVTLDSKHSEMIEKFNYQEEEELPKLKEQLALIKKKMKSNEITLDEKIDLDHEKRDIKKKIRSRKRFRKKSRRNGVINELLSCCNYAE